MGHSISFLGYPWGTPTSFPPHAVFIEHLSTPSFLQELRSPQTLIPDSIDLELIAGDDITQGVFRENFDLYKP